MAGVNKVILLGNVGKDPEVRALDNGRKVAKFPLATSETYVRNGERVDKTTWHNVVFWGNIVDVIDKYVKKGSQLYIEGKIVSRSYDDATGQKRYVTDIEGSDMTMVGSRPAGSNNAPDHGEDPQESYTSESTSIPTASTSIAPTTASSALMSTGAAEDDLPF